MIGLYHVDFRHYRKHTFEDPMEITSLLDNISAKDGEPYLHLHINLCRDDMSVIVGHLNECRISAIRKHTPGQDEARTSFLMCPCFIFFICLLRKHYHPRQ